jgi:hypothetical protein
VESRSSAAARQETIFLLTDNHLGSKSIVSADLSDQLAGA